MKKVFFVLIFFLAIFTGYNAVATLLASGEEYYCEEGYNVLIAYFSPSGIIGKVAKNLSQGILELSQKTYGIRESADLFEIKPEQSYTIEMHDENIRPVLTDKLESPDKYNMIFIGYPLWLGRAPAIVDTFLETYDFYNAKVIPFTISEKDSSDAVPFTKTGTLSDKNIKVKSGYYFHGDMTPAQLADRVGFDIMFMCAE